MEKLQHDEVGKAKVTYAAMVDSVKNPGEVKFEIGFEVTQRVLGEREDSPTEDITPYDAFDQLHLSEEGDPEGKRRNIARDQIRRLTGEEIEDAWSDAGYFRLAEDHKKSLVPLIEGKEVLVRAREHAGKIYHSLFFPRAKPKARSLADWKKAKKEAY